MPIILATVQTRVKDTVASSPVVGVAVRANGEEQTQVIDRNGNIWRAEITTPTVAPVLGNIGGGTLTTNRNYAYRYVYASSKNYPLVENELAINGHIYPRGNPSPKTRIQTTNNGVSVQVAYTARTDIDEIWIFRTAAYASGAAGQAEADNAAEAGLLYYVGKVTNVPGGGTTTYNDLNGTQGVDQIEMDNYAAPTFQFVIYYDPYWFGFGNYTFYQPVTWDVNGLITLTSGTWFNGRDGQFFTVSGVTTGGFDGLGGYKFKWVSSTTAQATLDGTTAIGAGTFPAMGVGTQYITIQGTSTTIYRSKARNPFAWGWTRVVGNLRTAQLWALKVGGGIGTAISVVPNEPILKVDCEFPAKCFSLNLQLAKDYDAFTKSKRIVSDVFSVTSHWSQFTAMTANGIPILWGMDYKNFAILQSNGLTQIPIAGPIPRVLRRLTRDRTRQLLSHGIYDPYTELNCMWVSTEDGVSLVDYLIFQHAPSGFWGFAAERDVLCSASIPDSTTGEIKTLVGTETGLYGQAFAPGYNYNWLPESGLYMGTVSGATTTTITAAEAGVSPFNTVDPGMVGNWCLVTDANDETEQWARIASVTATTLTFDIVISYMGTTLTQFDPVPAVDSKFYVGMIECRLRKLFDLQLPSTDKQFMEFWLTQQNVDTTAVDTLMRLYREREATDYVSQVTLERNTYEAGDSDVWFNKDEIPGELLKSFTMELINRGYTEWTIYNYVMKVHPVA